jgi:hypothetical protein
MGVCEIICERKEVCDSSFYFFKSRCEGITSPESSKSIVVGIIEEEEEDEEGSESVNKRKKEDDMEVGENLHSWKEGKGWFQVWLDGEGKMTLFFLSTIIYFREQKHCCKRYLC